MQRVILSVFVVLALITIDATFSKTYADTKIKIFKVIKVPPHEKLQLRAWPSSKSRIKKSLPFNAKDLTETGKKRAIGKTQWIEVNWKNNRGWVNSSYLKKTGVLLKAKSKNIAVLRASRNKNTTKQTAENSTDILPVIPNNTQDEMPTTDILGDRYDQPIQVKSTEMKTAFFSQNNNMRKK